jgi:hypothetical protein
MLALAAITLVVISLAYFAFLTTVAKRGFAAGKYDAPQAVRLYQGAAFIPIVFGVAVILLTSSISKEILSPTLVGNFTIAQQTTTTLVALFAILFGAIFLMRSTQFVDRTRR